MSLKKGPNYSEYFLYSPVESIIAKNNLSSIKFDQMLFFCKSRFKAVLLMGAFINVASYCSNAS